MRTAVLICPKCGAQKYRDPRTGNLRCNRCAGATLLARRESFKLQGLCSNCGKVEPDNGCVNCAECRGRKADSAKKIYQAREPFACRRCGVGMPTNEVKHCRSCLDQFNLLKTKAQELGLCVRCKTRQSLPPFVTCDRCRTMKQGQLDARVAADLCGYGGDCPNPPVQGKRSCEFHLARHRAQGETKRRADRARVIAAYGGACACCGETIPEFLAIDHVHGNGNNEAGNRLVLKVIREGFPDRFRILCHNCNMARSICGQCPHEKTVLRLVAQGV